MKLHILSDLHLRSRAMAPVPVMGDVLVLAGDISDGELSLTLDLTAQYRAAQRPILYVPGNHEYDGHEIARELWNMSRICPRNGITLLHNRAVILGGVRFAGTTLWTDFDLDAKPAVSMALAQTRVSDYKQIREGQRALAPASTVKYHLKARAFLDRVFAEPFDGPTVVVTHHGVHPRSIHARHAGDSLNPVYISDMTSDVRRWCPSVMIHGHVHNQFDYRIGETRVITNPRGRITTIEDFDGELLERLDNEEFDPHFTVEL